MAWCVVYRFLKGERVLHKEEGEGEVIRIWPKQGLVTVKFGNGKETWIVPAKELTPL